MATKQRNQVPKGKHGGMQLVLTEDVPNLGKQGDVVEVKPGYGRNYLIPRGMATIPTQHNLRLLERYKIRVKQALEARLADLRSLAAQITNMTEFVTIEANAQRVEEDGKEKYHLYGSVGQHEISKALRGKGLPIDPEMVVIEGGGVIKEAGLFAVKLNLGHGIESEAKVAVIPSKT
jgi:large subunit ribosomal protein L9